MRSLAALPGDPGSTPSSYMVGHNGLNYQFQWICPSLAHVCSRHPSCKDTHEGKILMYIKLKIRVETKNISENSFDSSTRDNICAIS